ncbi:High affinity choline transporter 1 [Merluccius polli]|uniref:High affinity choline transporter 1 n=1 Tax=Merluccius polli TaxID=89951 RepID=A0AA47PCN0_MERPO|nr:High affinity choline transporter 1 [Merluccius polli]
MRSKRYITMLDPFQRCYGNSFTAALLFPALISDVLWRWCLSFWVVYSVIYTDVIQLCLIAIGLWAFLKLSNNIPWLGELKLEDAGRWSDELLILVSIGAAWQCLHQRLLSAASYTQAQLTCFVAAITCFLLGIPFTSHWSRGTGPLHVHANWNQTGYGLPPPYDVGKIPLPLALQYLTPTWVSVLGIGSVAAAVMSSMDSVLLSSASMSTQNIYKTTSRKGASERELLWVIRICVVVVVVGAAGTGLTFVQGGVFSLHVLTGDWGAATGAALCHLLPWLEGRGQACVPAVSYLAQLRFTLRLLPLSWDVPRVFGEKDQAEGEAHNERTRETNTMCDTRL